MEKKENSQLKSNVISGISSTVGAAVGVAVGSMATAEVNAAEMPEVTAEEQEVEVVSAEPLGTGGSSSNHGTHHTAQPEPVNQAPVAQETADSEPAKPETTQQEQASETVQSEGQQASGNNEVEVLACETVTGNDGSQMDIAVVSANGQEIIIGDVNQDGVADVMASDVNGNGQLEGNEIVDISNENISMQPFHDAANDNMMAQTDDIDYVNDANVNDYMA